MPPRVEYSEPSGELAKAYGAFYTDTQIAEFLVAWAVRSGTETILDPSFGGGVFLRAACQRLKRLGGCVSSQVCGVEIDEGVHAEIASRLMEEFGIAQQNLQQADFFTLAVSPGCQVDAVVGNPPFIRYQRFMGNSRAIALDQAARDGVRLSGLCSSWAPFLVHSIAMVKPGGRLAMVAPMELTHAAYARPVLKHLFNSFRRVNFLTFKKKLFPGLSEDTLLVLAEVKGIHQATFHNRDFVHSGQLSEILDGGFSRTLRTSRMDAKAIGEGSERLVEYFIPRKARELYRELMKARLVEPLGELADVGIGYVTGANEFFHLSPLDVTRFAIPRSYLRPAVKRGRALKGLRFSESDWEKTTKTGEAGFLLYVEADSDLPLSVKKYLNRGYEMGIPKAYKCRVRSPWYKVPHVYQPDGFLSYMSGRSPSLVTNDAFAVAPNSLHVLRLHSGARVSCDAIAASWQTSLTRLSVEIEGHSLGGGMLKIEPTEAERVLLAVPRLSTRRTSALATELDAIVRSGDQQLANSRADQVILKDLLGLTKYDCRLLHTAAEELRDRRYSRSTVA